MESESVNDVVFEEYRQLEPRRRSIEHYVVAFLHLVAAIIISVSYFSDGLTPWFQGYGIVTPILLIIHGFLYTQLENDTWYREQMVPFISRLIATTEIETDRYCQFHRRVARIFFVIGYFVILLCQWVWTFGVTVVLPLFLGDDILTRLVVELLAYAILFGPFILYFLVLMPVAAILDKLFLSRYSDITHLLDIEKKWTTENNRRVKNPESVQEEVPADNQWF